MKHHARNYCNFFIISIVHKEFLNRLAPNIALHFKHSLKILREKMAMLGFSYNKSYHDMCLRRKAFLKLKKLEKHEKKLERVEEYVLKLSRVLGE